MNVSYSNSSIFLTSAGPWSYGSGLVVQQLSVRREILLMNVLRVARGWWLSLLMVAAFSMLVETVGQTQKKKAATGKGFGKVVLYTGIGPVLTQYDVDVSAATLTMRDSVTLPGAVTETAFHPSRKYLYAVWGNVQVTPRTHGMTAFSINSDSGALT